MSSGIETEVKIQVADPESAQRLLERAGFQSKTPRTFERNVIYDTSDSSLRQRRSVLRLRQSGTHALLTYKGPTTENKFKSRQEIETQISSFDAASEILGCLGYMPTFVYEKYRSEWYHTQYPGGLATIDEMPVGTYLELEGPPDWIDRAALQMGFESASYITASYGKLYIEHCRRSGIAPTNWTFDK